MNVCIFTGRLVRDVEKRILNNEKKTPTAFYTIAVPNPFYKDKTDFISCQSFGSSMEYLVKNGKKGMLIEFSGSASTYQQKDEKGVSITKTNFVSDEVKLIYTTGKPESEPQQGTADEPTKEEEHKVVEDDLPF
jgi:single-strand DNA-binding protein